MTLMGKKKDQNQPRKPMRRSSIRRSTPKTPQKQALKPRTGVKAGHDKARADSAFMGQFVGLPSIVSGRTNSEFLKDENGERLKTEGHHILPKSVYPEYRYTKENIAVLTRDEHSYVEDHPNEFMSWLERNMPEVFEWAMLHKNHKHNDRNQSERSDRMN